MHTVGTLSIDGGCLSVRLSVCPVPDHKSRMGGHRKLKIGREESHDTCDQWPHLEVERLKVKVIKLKSQVKTASVLQRWPQLLAPPAE